MPPRINSVRKPLAPLKGGDQASYFSVEQVKRNHKSSESWVSPHYGDGGWHETPGCPAFNPLDLVPLRDHILVRLFPERFDYAHIIRPEGSSALNPESRRGVILKVGPGRWVDGEFERTEVRPGMEVTIGPHHDYQSSDAGYGENIVLCQEADIRVIHWRRFNINRDVFECQYCGSLAFGAELGVVEHSANCLMRSVYGKINGGSA